MTCSKSKLYAPEKCKYYKSLVRGTYFNMILKAEKSINPENNNISEMSTSELSSDKKIDHSVPVLL